MDSLIQVGELSCYQVTCLLASLCSIQSVPSSISSWPSVAEHFRGSPIVFETFGGIWLKHLTFQGGVRSSRNLHKEGFESARWSHEGGGWSMKSTPSQETCFTMFYKIAQQLCFRTSRLNGTLAGVLALLAACSGVFL